MDPIAVSVKLGCGESLVKGNRVELAELAGLFPGVALDLKAFEGFLIREVAEESMSKLVEQEEAEVVVGLEVINGSLGTKEKLAAGAEGEAGIGFFKGVKEGEIGLGEERSLFRRLWWGLVVANVVGVDRGGHGVISGSFVWRRGRRRR